MKESLVETIDLDIDESNELLFKVKVDGADPAPVKIRLVCEDGDLAYMFNGSTTGNDVVQFNSPPLGNKLKEGTYNSRIEVLIDSRYFEPVKFQIKFKKTFNVVAESITKASKNVSVSADPSVSIKKTLEHKILNVQKINKPVVESKVLPEDEPLNESETLNEDAILAAAQKLVEKRKKKKVQR